MKLGKVTSNDPLKRQAVSLHQSVSTQLDQYRAFYQSVHGDDISLSLLIEEICKRFMREDRDFQKFLQHSPPGAAQAAPRTGAKV